MSRSEEVGEAAFGVMNTGSEQGREEEAANRWPSVVGLSSFTCPTRVPFLLLWISGFAWSPGTCIQ